MSLFRHRSRAEMREWLQTNVRREDECLLWAGATADGYPVVCWSARSRRCMARALLLELRGRELPARPVVWSVCGHRLCMRPEHLRAGTRADMVAWIAAEGRYPTGARRSLASASGRASRLGVVHARAVADLQAQGQTYREIAQQYGVDPSAVGHALQRWRRAGLIM